jgi:hypothetical protein
MRSTIPSPFSNPHVYIFHEKTIQSMKKQVILLILFVLFCTSIMAQVSKENSPVTVTDVNSYIGATNRFASASASIDAQNLKSLLTNVQPSIYYYGGDLKTYGEKPKNIFTDLTSFSMLNRVIEQKNNIEIIEIRIDNAAQLNQSVDLNLLSSFKNLKYICFISNIAVTSDAIAKLIANNNEKYSIFYKINKGDSSQ